MALNECKLIFIGDGGAGKTSLMRRLVYKKFNKKEPTTHGINKIAWNEIKNKNFEPIRINLWDFGGQHIQHSLHQFFFTERVIYVLVLNPRNDEKAAYWLEQVKKLGDGSKVLVVYNWKQEQDKKASYLSNFYELRKKYPEIMGPYLLSCAVKGSEQEFKNVLIETIKNHENLNDPYPNTWYEIKKTVEDKVTVGKNYVAYEQYEQWCSDNDYKDAEKQKSLLVILNRIGSIVFFDKPVLDRLQVLNPEWITTGAYAILTSEITAQKQGRLTIKDFKEIFKEPREIFSDKEIKIQYTETHFEFIIQLMLEYNLICEEKVGKHTEYLVPSCFKEKPAKDYDAHKQNARWYRVQFDAPFEMLIIQRFIARKIAFAVGEEYWQSGIFMKDNVGETYALAETNLYSYCIDFWIKGDNVRGLWESIRRELREVLSMYKKLDYKEEVGYEADNKVVFLPYKEMLKTLEKGIKVIEYHPTYDISNIDVLEVLDMFEDRSQINKKEPKNKVIKIFLASSAELETDRRDFEIFINRENKELIDDGIFIKLIIWEDFIDAMSKTRLQDEYNREVRGADIFVSLFYSKVGKYTNEEFNKAFGQFIKSGKPLVYTYFKNGLKGMNEIKEADIKSKFKFERQLKALGHFPTPYQDITDLKLQFKNQLQKLMSEGRI